MANGTWTNFFTVADSDGAAFSAATEMLQIGPVAPVLTIALIGQQVLLSWPQSAVTFYLESTTNIAIPSSWATLTNVPVLTNGQYTVTLPAIGARKFFRLDTEIRGVVSPVLLSISLTNNDVVLAWPSSSGNFGLQVNTNLFSIGSWSAVTNVPATNGSTASVTLPITTANRFFRLKSL